MRSFKFLQTAALAGILLLFSCKQKKLASPPHYKFKDVFTVKLDPKLKEISGIAWDGKINMFLAIDDEMGKVFYLGRDTRAIMEEYDFAPAGDFEDVAIYNGIPYILRSDGHLFRFNKDTLDGKGAGHELGQLPVTGTNDFETLYADLDRKALVILCKTCAGDDVKSVTAFAYYPDSIGFDPKPIFVINAEMVEKLSPFHSTKFEPSAAAVNPAIKKLFVISSTSRQLAICDMNGQVESVYKLSSQLFPQPEGITFRQNGDMFISNEGGGGKSTLLIFPYFKDTANSLAPASRTSHYNFNSPDDRMQLGKHLHEISGISFISGTDNMLAENDEKGDIFTVDFRTRNDKVGKVKFGGKGDYEDIVYSDSAIYMLVSSGTIVKVSTKDSSMLTTDYVLDGRKNEFESMYLDRQSQSLILLCKDCQHEKDEVRNAYQFDLTKNIFNTEPVYTIQISAIRDMLKDPAAEFKPSAAGINPIDGKLYVVASVGKLLLVADRYGKPEQVYKLDPALFNQPEGLAFAANGDLYISNEGGEGIATILKFTYRK